MIRDLHKRLIRTNEKRPTKEANTRCPKIYKRDLEKRPILDEMKPTQETNLS